MTSQSYTAANGILLQNAGGTGLSGTVLATYDQTSFATNISGPCPSTALTSNVLLTRVGNIVTITVPTIQANGNSTSALITFTNTVPSGFTPNSASSFTSTGVLVFPGFQSATTSAMGAGLIFPNGVIQVYAPASATNVVVGNYASTANLLGFASWSATYLT